MRDLAQNEIANVIGAGRFEIVINPYFPPPPRLVCEPIYTPVKDTVCDRYGCWTEWHEVFDGEECYYI